MQTLFVAMAMHPEVQEKARAELDAVVGERGTNRVLQLRLKRVSSDTYWNRTTPSSFLPFIVHIGNICDRWSHG